jgi:hypothetical protein
MKATNKKQVLLATRWIITNIGWCQGMAWKDKKGHIIFGKETILNGKATLGACCLSGAIGLVECEKTTMFGALNTIEKAIDQTHVTTWNDKKGRTKEQVLALLDKLIQEQP